MHEARDPHSVCAHELIERVAIRHANLLLCRARDERFVLADANARPEPHQLAIVRKHPPHENHVLAEIAAFTMRHQLAVPARFQAADGRAEPYLGTLAVYHEPKFDARMHRIPFQTGCGRQSHAGLLAAWARSPGRDLAIASTR